MSAQLTICNGCVKLMEKVSAVLHMDEKTPHIHATIISIVTENAEKPNSSRKEKRNIARRTLHEPSVSTG